MPTYAQIRAFVKDGAGFVPRTCWIADVKAQRGLTTRIAHNRLDPTSRVHSCPESKRHVIESAIDHFYGMQPKKTDS